MANILKEEAANDAAELNGDTPSQGGHVSEPTGRQRKAHVDDDKVGLGTYRIDKETKVMFEAVARLHGELPAVRLARLMTQDTLAARPRTEEAKQ